MSLHRYYHKRLALADMTAQRVSIVPLEDDMLTAAAGGAVLGSLLLQRYTDAFALCAGPLTGSFAPCSGLAAAVFRLGGELCRLPVLQGIGAMLRQCGVDALALTGRADTPLVLRLARGAGRLEAVKTPLTPDHTRAALREALLRGTQDGCAALLLAGAESTTLRGAGTHLGPVQQGGALAQALHERNCAALVLEGGTALPPIPLLPDSPLRTRLASRGCFAEELAACGMRIPADMRWKSAACYHCPAPCQAWIKLSSGAYVFCADHRAFAALAKACGQAAPDALAACDLFGLDPQLAAPLLQGATIADLPALLEKVLEAAAPDDAQPAVQEEYTQSMRAGMVLGICPHLLRRNPSVTQEELVGLLDAKMQERLLAVLELAP